MKPTASHLAKQRQLVHYILSMRLQTKLGIIDDESSHNSLVAEEKATRRQKWEGGFLSKGVCKLPFIDESCLLSETKKLVKDLGVEESERNMHKCDQLLIQSTHELGSHILLGLATCPATEMVEGSKVFILNKHSGGLLESPFCRNCSCSAYALSGVSGCMLWFDDNLVDMIEYNVGGQDLYIKMAASELVNLNKNLHQNFIQMAIFSGTGRPTLTKAMNINIEDKTQCGDAVARN
ncbi:hypothetical protein G4B88_015497 [Cannabis sativa]|uniref:Uncharacterized protein n=1 Tax=Cannabis sativa TaxID=3483 RepID=A0A7J6GE42_CANSA|nr:hypothetical protein G4B88_015497 [Cannabis sativa]